LRRWLAETGLELKPHSSDAGDQHVMSHVTRV
jgi:hypothetical protein